ncbi:MAG: shikimate kinase / 3-dehydroquinate synthase [Chloroflexota bacterium]|jgi:3-dehydroquinate synthetase/shikimate kinase|nr:shikimate kinase / 3-dehydroquinate synthase [Chloroflexota bacterium]
MSEAAARRLVALVGLPGSGKTYVGRQLAERLGRPFVDLDELVESRSGRAPASWLEAEGEPRFREVESEALAEAVATPDAVIATGGGSIIDPLNRWALAEAATVVWLDAADEMLLERLSRSSVSRPLLRTPGSGGPAAALAGLRHAREPFYRAADVHVDAGPPVDAVVAEILERLEELGATQARAAAGGAATSGPSSTRRLFDAIVPRHHPNGPAHARVVIGRDLDAATYRSVLAGASTGEPLVVADARAATALPALIAALPGARRIDVRAGEQMKRLRSVERLLESAASLGLERGDAWIAVGGGTTGDLVGTAASLYHRGAPLVHVPTTWLAQADSSIGGKAAVDLSHAKNAAGAFWPPVAVIADVASLRTLPRARLLHGMAESLKAGLIGDPWLWSLIERRGAAALDTAAPDEAARYAIVERAARLKLGIVERDPYERGERRSLNLGHTLGHALEVESGYALPHGQAVILGLRAVAAIAVARGVAVSGLADRIDALVSSLGYPMHRQFDPVAVRAALGSDKKRVAGRGRWILPVDVGEVREVDDVTEAEVEDALRTITPAGMQTPAGTRTRAAA